VKRSVAHFESLACRRKVAENGLSVKLGCFGAYSFNLLAAKAARGLYGFQDLHILSCWSLEICE
jgi:hypothetical protein